MVSCTTKLLSKRVIGSSSAAAVGGENLLKSTGRHLWRERYKIFFFFKLL